MRRPILLTILLVLFLFLGQPCRARPWYQAIFGGSSANDGDGEVDRQEDSGFFRSVYRRFLDPGNPSSITSRVGRFFTGIYNFFRRSFGYDDEEKPAPPQRPSFEVPPPPNYPARPRPTQPPTEPPLSEVVTEGFESGEDGSSVPPSAVPSTVSDISSPSVMPEEPPASSISPVDNVPAESPVPPEESSPSSIPPAENVPTESPVSPEEPSPSSIPPVDNVPAESSTSPAPEPEENNTIPPSSEASSIPNEPSSPSEVASFIPERDTTQREINIIPLDTENRPNPLDTNIPEVIASEEDYDMNAIPDDTNLYIHVKDV